MRDAGDRMVACVDGQVKWKKKKGEVGMQSVALSLSVCASWFRWLCDPELCHAASRDQHCARAKTRNFKTVITDSHCGLRIYHTIDAHDAEVVATINQIHGPYEAVDAAIQCLRATVVPRTTNCICLREAVLEPST